MEKLSVIAAQNETAKNVFEVFRARERFRKETNLSRLQRTLLEEGKKVVDDEFIGLFQKLQDLGIGTLVVGRGKPTRFKWHYNLRDVAKAASTNKPVPVKAKVAVAAPAKAPETVTLTIEQLEVLIDRVIKKRTEGSIK